MTQKYCPKGKWLFPSVVVVACVKTYNQRKYYISHKYIYRAQNSLLCVFQIHFFFFHFILENYCFVDYTQYAHYLTQTMLYSYIYMRVVCGRGLLLAFLHKYSNRMTCWMPARIIYEPLKASIIEHFLPQPQDSRDNIIAAWQSTTKKKLLMLRVLRLYMYVYMRKAADIREYECTYIKIFCVHAKRGCCCCVYSKQPL